MQAQLAMLISAKAPPSHSQTEAKLAQASHPQAHSTPTT